MTCRTKKPKYLKMTELGELLGVRYSKIKYYAELGLLPFERREARGVRHYPVKEVKKRLKEIDRLQNRGLNMSQIIKFLANKPRPRIFLT